jgi:hypothetical protein
VRPILTVLAVSMTTVVAMDVDENFLLSLFFGRRVPTRRIVAGPDLEFAARVQLLAFGLRRFWS